MAGQPLGQLVRIAPFELFDLPSHPLIAQPVGTPSSRKRVPLRTYLVAILQEAASFLDPADLTSTFSTISTKSSPPSSSHVELFKRNISASQISSINWSNGPVPRKQPAQVEGENWFARRSIHENESVTAKKGTANWPEFVFGIKQKHSKHEQDFTPTLYDAHHILDWNEEIKRLEGKGAGEGEGFVQDGDSLKYTEVTMEIYEMCHSLPGPLAPRCFPVLVVTAYDSATSFLVVTVPVNMYAFDTAYYSSSRNTTEPSATSQQRKKPVLGDYVAVERVRILGTDNGPAGSKYGDIEWIMATASNAKGNLPMFLQKPNLPAAIAKDVGWFLKWIRTVNLEVNQKPTEEA